MQRQKIAAILGAAFLQSVFHHIGIGDVIGEIMQCAYGMCIGDGFNVKGEYRCHGSSLGGLQAAYCTDLASTWRKNLSKASAKACGASHCNMWPEPLRLTIFCKLGNKACRSASKDSTRCR